MIFMGINTKYKNCISLLLLLTACSVIIAACEKAGNNTDMSENKSKQNLTTDNNYLKWEISDNLLIDTALDYGDISVCDIYEVIGKDFNVEQLKSYFWNNTAELTTDTNTSANEIWLNDTTGAELMVKTGSMTFAVNQDFYQLPDLIKSAYEKELSNISDEQIQAFRKKKIISEAAELIKKIYNPSKYEEISLIRSVKIDREWVMQIQDSGLPSNLIGNETYYLFFGVSYNGIPMTNSNEYAFSAAYEDAVISYESIEAIVDENGICFLHMDGLFDVKEKEAKKIMPVESGIQTLKKKYDLLILSEKQIINSIYLEYVFVHDAYSKDSNKGKLVPYWCFNNDTAQHADRFSAITGKDFQYE